MFFNAVDNYIGNLILTNIEPDENLYGFQSEELYYFACNNDSRNDFVISIETYWGQGGGFLYRSILKIKTLTSGAYISTDTSRNPEIYIANDTITIDKRWKKGEFELLGFEITSSDINSDKPLCQTSPNATKATNNGKIYAYPQPNSFICFRILIYSLLLNSF